MLNCKYYLRTKAALKGVKEGKEQENIVYLINDFLNAYNNREKNYIFIEGFFVMKDKFMQAFNKGEVVEYLSGEKEYKIELSQRGDCPGPTDWTQIIPKGIYEAYIDNPDIGIKETYEKAIIDLIGRGGEYYYIATSVIFFQLIRENSERSPFNINRGYIINILKTKGEDEKLDLLNTYKYVSQIQQNGLWSQIERMNNLAMKKWGISLIN